MTDYPMYPSPEAAEPAPAAVDRPTLFDEFVLFLRMCPAWWLPPVLVCTALILGYCVHKASEPEILIGPCLF